MEEDLRESLLSKKGVGFNKMFQDCMVKIQRIKQKNDLIQKQIGTDIEESIRSEVNNQKKFIEKEITELKNVMGQMEGKYRDPESKTKLKQLKADAQKQIERNKIILKELINKSFLAHSIGKPNEAEDSARYMEGGRVDYQSLGSQRKQQTRQNHSQDMHQQSLLTDQDLEVDYEIERKILLQKNEMINEVEQSALRINEIMNQIGVMVGQQGQNLDVISDELLKTNQNLVETNKNMDQAVTLQKKSKKKYIILVVIILLIIVVVVGVVLILKV